MEILIVVDMQNDFVSGALGTPEAGEIVPYVVGRVVEGMNRGEEILFTRDTHEANYLSTQEGKKLPVPHCIDVYKRQQGVPGAPGVGPGQPPGSQQDAAEVPSHHTADIPDFLPLKYVQHGLAGGTLGFAVVGVADRAALPQ